MPADLRLTLRGLRQSPGFAAVAVLTLALGIGVNATMFSIVNTVLLRGLPFPEQARLLAIETGRTAQNDHDSPLSPGEFLALRERQKSFEDVSAFSEGSVLLSGLNPEPERVIAATFSGPGPALLRVSTMLGRWFGPEEDRPGAAPTVVLGQALWENRFQSDPAIVGRQVKLEGEWSTIIGVAPKGFSFPERAVIWRPWRQAPTAPMGGYRHLAVFGRLKPGLTVAQARAELAAIGRRWELDHAGSNAGVVLSVRPLQERFVDETSRKLLHVMLGAVFLVLLIACGNVANLLLARAAVREREMAIRAALGASRAVIVRLLLTESLVLSLAGAALGLLLAEGLLAGFRRELAEVQPPQWMVFNLDATGLAYLVLLAGASCVLAGLFPAWRVSRPDLGAVLKDGGRGATGFALSRFTRAMVVGEVAVSCVLLVLATLAARSIVRINAEPLGYEAAGVFTCRIDLPGSGYPDAARQREFYRQLLGRLAARPEVAAVTVSSVQPTWAWRQQVEFEGRPRGGPRGSGLPEQYAARADVAGSYFATLGIPLTLGRTFDDHDTAAAPKVAIVSTRFAEQHWPGANPLGERFVFGLGLEVKPQDWMTVVGVVRPTLQGNFNASDARLPQVYVPFTQHDDTRNMTVFVRARGGEAAALAPLVRTTVRSLDNDLPIFWVRTLVQMVDQAKVFKRLLARIFGVFGAVALLIAAVGLYGVMSYSVSQRTQEIGVRMALGAERRDVLGLILRQGGGQIGIGLGLGLPAAYYAGRLLADVLYGVEPGDAGTLGIVMVTLGATGFAACLVPAMRAARVNPIEALRCE